MMGKDCERILASIISIKNVITDAIKGISDNANYKITVKGSHSKDDTSITLTEEPHISSNISSYIGNIKSVYSSFSGDMDKMNSLASSMYTSVETFNNSYGSPWRELKDLEESINNVISFGDSSSLGSNIAILGLLNIALVCTVDAKWALLTYNDYIQRGFDTKFNSNAPSITFKKANKKRTIGNINQSFAENVNIPEESIDPY